VRCARRARVLRSVSCVVDVRFVRMDRASSPRGREQNDSDSRAYHISSPRPLKQLPRHRGGPVASRGDEVR
jgi:hypothetical protein